jgi:YHS domain-containing protein
VTEAPTCVICHRPLGERPFSLRYEMRVYRFDRDTCKRIFQENPDRYLDAEGAVLPEPRG